MNRSQLEHIIRAASDISDDTEIVVIGSQAIHAQDVRLPPIAFLSAEADVYPRNKPERADEIDAAVERDDRRRNRRRSESRDKTMC